MKGFSALFWRLYLTVHIYYFKFSFSICKCLNVGKYEQRVLEGLEAMKLPCSKVRLWLVD